jgi:hypothetical protein
MEKVKLYNIDTRDLYQLALIEKEKSKLSILKIYKKEKLKAQSIGILKKYKVKFLDIGAIIQEINKNRENIIFENEEKYIDVNLTSIDSTVGFKYGLQIGAVLVIFFGVLYFITNSGNSACDCANLYEQSPFKKEYSAKELNDGYTLQNDADAFVNKAKDCALKYGNLTDIEKEILKDVLQVGMIPKLNDAIENAKKECAKNKSFSDSELKLACDCWNQSVAKTDMAFDDMNSNQQEFRKKCFEVFKDEETMKVACEKASGVSNSLHNQVESTAVVSKKVNTTNTNLNESKYPIQFSGTIGDKSLFMVFRKGDINFSVVEGENQVGNNKRPISGYFVDENDKVVTWKILRTPGSKFKVICQEPGNHKYDGSFNLIGTVGPTGKISLTGVWEMYSNGFKQNISLLEN